MKTKPFKNISLNFIIRWILLFVIAAGILYLSSIIYSTFFSNGEDYRQYNLLSIELKHISVGIFTFFLPFIKLIIILLIVEWILGKLGMNFEKKSTNLEWNVQTLIGVMIIFGFVIAALLEMKGVTYLKDIALVVVGFYFGSQRKTIEYESDGKKIKIEEEHTNENNKNI